MDEMLRTLGDVTLFAGLDHDALAEIAPLADEIDVPAGTALTHEGRYEGYFYVVRSGAVRIERGDALVDEIGPGGSFGEIALIDAGPRTATTTAASDCHLLRITNEGFADLLDRYPSVRDAIVEQGEQRLHRIDEDAF